tara:strand:- start:415 stop:717 length:303 start_codon:yes stop_codon:yes gene_type:complete
MKNKRLSKQVKKIINNKTIHVEFPGELHKKLRTKLFLDEMSMQKFFRLMAEKYVNDDLYLKELVHERIDELKNKKVNNLKDINEKDLYSAIEENSPFKKD